MSVLLIEDDEKTARFVKRGLEAEGIPVKRARDGVSGAAIGAMKSTRVIILDPVLPDMDGFDLCRRLRADGFSTPILMLTGRVLIGDKVEGFAAGADDYLTKPFAFEELLARVRALMRRAPSLDAAPATLQVRDLVFDRGALRVRRGERDISLTSMEMAILEVLMLHPDQAMSRERIWSAVRGAGEAPSANIVDVYIGRLRKKLDGPGEPPIVETLRRRGYRLVAPPIGNPSLLTPREK